MKKVAVIGIVGNSVFLPVDHFHEGGETIEASSVRFELGGKGFNQAVAAARMGADVAFLAATGNSDLYGVSEFLENEGIHAVLIPKNSPSAFAAIITDAQGTNRVTVYQGAQLEAGDVELFRTYIEEADILLLNNEVEEAVNLAAVRIAAEKHVRIILNPAPARPSAGALLDAVYLFTPNEHEAQGLEGYSNVVQTLGKNGCLIRAENTVIPATGEVAVDTTGAGDTFNGVLAAELSAGCPLSEAVRTAVRASGKSVTKPGAVSSIPYRADILT